MQKKEKNDELKVCTVRAGPGKHLRKHNCGGGATHQHSITRWMLFLHDLSYFPVVPPSMSMVAYRNVSTMSKRLHSITAPVLLS